MAASPAKSPMKAAQHRPMRLNKDLVGFKESSLDRSLFPVMPPAEETELKAVELVKAPCATIDASAQPLVAVIGVGYVGTHLVDVFSRKFDTLGFDVSERRVAELQQTFANNDRVSLTSCARDLRCATHFLISVPTLLLSDRTIDASYLCSALTTVADHARPGATVVIESSVAVSMTRELLGPLAKLRGYYAGMSPERVDPGRVEPAAYAIPKVVSGLDDVVPGSLSSIVRLYSAAFDRIVPVSKPEVAEMTKLYENCQRMMCIAYANEMADAYPAHGIDPFEVCRAAATKPFGYMSFLPGVGVGGHCIPVNTYYLLSNSAFPLLDAASAAMARRPAVIARRAVERLTQKLSQTTGKAAGQSSEDMPRVLVVGVCFKAGQATLSNSPSLDLATHLSSSGLVHVSFADPLVPQEALSQVSRLPDDAWNRQTLGSFALIIVTMRQEGLDFAILDDLRDVEVEWWCP